MAKARTKTHLLVAGVGGTFVRDRVEWLRAEVLKTRVAFGYCSRHAALAPVPTPTSASSATTSPRHQSSPARSTISWPTSGYFARMPPPGVGTPKLSATTGSSTSIDAHTRRLRSITTSQTAVDPPPERRPLAFGFVNAAEFEARELLLCPGTPA